MLIVKSLSGSLREWNGIKENSVSLSFLTPYKIYKVTSYQTKCSGNRGSEN